MNKPNLTEISRRRMLQGAAGLAGVASIGLPSWARAQAAGTVVVGTWGGD
jgi:putative spermidine/putrescine transport system substrate-binding protein